MFALFYSLYFAMFSGTWNNYGYFEVLGNNSIKNALNSVGKLLTSIINEGVTYDTFGTDVLPNLINVVSLVLALITSIGIVVMAVKGVKKAFGIFFGHIR